MRTSSHFGPIPGEVRDPSLSRETHQRFPGLKKEHFANKNWTWSSLVWTQLSDVNPCQSPRNPTQHISYQIQVSCISDWFQKKTLCEIPSSIATVSSRAPPPGPPGPPGAPGAKAVTSAWSASWLVSLELNSAQRLSKSGGSRSQLFLGYLLGATNQAVSYMPTYKFNIYISLYISFTLLRTFSRI